jgi:putative tricarboxylic transport membrane protein
VKKILIGATAFALFASGITAAPANAAPVAASSASVLAECATVGAVAAGKGADGSNLVCKKATVGGMKGKTVWQYATLPIIKDVDMIIPNSPTSGFAGFGRAINDALKAEGLTTNEPVLTYKLPPYNGPLRYLNVDMAGKAGKLAVTGLAVVGGGISSNSAFKASDAEPVARMYAEWIGVGVKADSKYKTMKQLVADLKKDPKAMAIIGGTLGGVDTYTAAQMFKALKLDIANLNYTGSGNVQAGILSDANYAFAISSYGDFKPFVEAGTIRVLAISAPAKVKGITAPTLKASGVNTVVENWRGILVPPKTSPKAQALVLRALDVVRASKSYNAYLASFNASSAWLPGAKFDTFLKGFETDLRKLYIDLGLL